MNPNEPQTTEQKLAAWTALVPEHVRPLAQRFTECRAVARDGGNLIFRKAKDAETGTVWGRVNVHADGSFECYRVTDPPPEAVPAFMGEAPMPHPPPEPPRHEQAHADRPAEPPAKTWGDRKRK